jgi:hypothetical protein
MDAMSTRAARLARGWLVGVFATALAALSHAVAGGGTPSGLALVVGAVFGGMLGTFALSARPSLPRLAIAIGVTQLAFHVAFSTLGEAAIASGPHLHGAITVGSPAHAHVDSPLMWLSHAVAGVVTLMLLRGAESAAWRLLAECARLVLAPFSVPRAVPAPVRPQTAAATGRVVTLTSRLLDRAVSRRGPPLSHA